MAGTYKRKDHFYRQAKEEGYQSRAAYKLKELDKKYKLFKPGFSVLDLGCFPGGWLQVAGEQIKESGLVVGVDKKPIELLQQRSGCAPVHFVLGDVCRDDVQQRVAEISGGRLQVILSDMSPQLSGIRVRDIMQSVALVEIAFEICAKLLKQDGSFVAKTFPSEETNELYETLRPSFKKLFRTQLKSSRQTSNELYFIGLGYRGADGE